MNQNQNIRLNCRRCGMVDQALCSTQHEKLFLFLLVAFWLALDLILGSALNYARPSFHLKQWALGDRLFDLGAQWSDLPHWALLTAATLTASALFVRFALGVRAGMWARCHHCGEPRRIRPWDLRRGGI